jgi:large subunit ribosomal protein L22
MAETQTKTISEVRAQAKWVHCSARKARLVLDTIRGRSVPEARTVLAFSTRDVARDIDKVLRSAVANAEANHGFFGDEMVISACYADEGPGLKRWKPRARGRADRFVKGTCHITIRLAPLAEETTAASSRPTAVTGTPEPAKRAARTPASELPVEAENMEPPVGAADATSGTTVKTSEKPADKAKPKAPRKAAAKPRAKKTDQGEAKPKAATKRKPKVKKEEE